MSRTALTAVTSIVLFVAALLANVRLAGTSPIVWIDTFNDELDVQRCLVDDSCTLTGMSTSVPGQAHAVAWLELRTLCAWLGIGIDGTHRAILVANAIAVVLIFQLATTLAGPLAGTVAAWLLMDHLDAFARVTALYNTSPMLFFGAAFVLACTAVVMRPGVASVTLAALLAAVMTNIHLACAMTGASVVWAALLAPQRRLALASLGGVLFLLATFAIAPPTWLHNLGSILRDPAVPGHRVLMQVPANPLMSWVVFAGCAWLVSFAIRTPDSAAYRRQSQGAFAVLVPSLVVFVIASRFGFNPEAKYIFHLKAACAIAAALPMGAVANRLLPLRMQQVLPFVLALDMAFTGHYAARARNMAADERTPTVADVAAVAHILPTEEGWSADEMLRNLKTPDGATLLSGLRQSVGRSVPAAPARSDGRSAMLLVLDAVDLPHPLPPSWRIVRRTGESLVVLVLTRARIDWHDLTVCMQPADGSPQRCDKRTWEPANELFPPHLPPGGVGWQGTLRVSFAVRAAEAGFVDEIFMPRMPFICAGRITAIPEGARSADLRSATLSSTAEGKQDPPIVTLEWNIGAAECSSLTYDGMVPFFVEGDAATVGTVATILRKLERSP